MTDPLLYPKLRWPLDLRLERIESKEVLILSCPLGIVRAPLLLVPEIAPIIGCFEGQLSIPEITAKFSAQGATDELISRIVSLLDENLFLVSPRFEAAHRSTVEEFRNAKVRNSALAGLGYPLAPRQLESLIDGYLSAGDQATLPRKDSLLGLVSPHIDYRRGGACYGLTYHYLKEQKHDLIILIGTSHQYSRLMFHLTAKDFDTPLGVLECDTEFIKKIAARHGLERSFADEMLHRREHSLELQTPFLKRVSSTTKIAPILVGSFHQMLTSGRLPHENEEYESFASALLEATRNSLGEGKKIGIVAGVDMAHVGRNFGDKGSLTPEFMKQIEARDQIYLQAIKTQDKRALFSHIAEDQDARRICGFPTMYTVIDLLDRLGIKYSAEIFDYRQAVDYESDCAVTFAGVGLYPATSSALQ